MPSTDEDYGSARITLELDDSGATREAASVGADIERALTRATRNIGTRIRQTIERGMRRTTVAVEPDLRQFERQLRTGMRSLNPVMVPVTADLRQFQRSMRSSGTQPINVPVTPDVTRFARTLTRALRGVQAEVQVRADARRMIQDIERELRRVSPPAISVRAEADVSRIRSQLNSLDPPTIEVTLSLDVDRIEEQLRELADREIHIPIGIGPAGAAGAAGATAGASVLGGLTSSLMAAGPWGAVVAAAAAYAAMIGKTLMAGIEGVIEQQRLTGALKASLGLGAQEAAAVGRVVGQLYARGVVESVEEGTSAVQAAIRNGLAAPDDIGLESLATQISDVGRLMEEDVGQVARAVGLMVKTGLVDNATEGLDLLTAGVQGGANAAEDLLELFSEYSTQFRQLGLSGQEAMGLIQQGLQGGARDADTIADAFKEFSIEAAAGGERVVDAFKAMDLDADRLSSAFAKGGPAAREALTEVLDSLRSIEDPLERNQVAIGLFGTKAEDLAGALQAIDLDTAAAEMDGFAGGDQACRRRPAEQPRRQAADGLP
ncbi:phage tail tape measure protein [Streptomyces flavovirens]|uniref:phage tail tape measure protein n=1 Tax=Streptomyces flavovirens TaxID=52258 RepID=UPI0031EBE573